MDAKQVLEKIILGIKSHCSEAGFEDVLIGASGGIDSALVATLAQKALGKAHVHLILMPSGYSSPESTVLGEKLAQHLDCNFDLVPIQGILDKYNQDLTLSLGHIKRTVVEENLQARIRGNILMAYANRFGALVLATGNKSEEMVGYCTLYGDTVGSLAPIADLYKTEVYELAHYINREKEIIPYEIIEREPSAELYPGQKDTDALPPYDVLDKILKGYEAKFSVAEIAENAGSNFIRVSAILTRINKNKFKEAQAAPVLKLGVSHAVRKT
jgi:NAD+ synthase (glutamine-hydrolysing)